MTRAVGARLAAASRGEFAMLLHNATTAAARSKLKLHRRATVNEEDDEWAARVRAVIGHVKRGEISKGAQGLMSTGVAAGTDAVERSLRDMLHCDAF